jgi:hypothetical protein
MLAANELTFIATSSQTAPWTHIQCIQNREDMTILDKLGYHFIWTTIEGTKPRAVGETELGKGRILPAA